MRLGFVLPRPLTQDQLEAWLGSIPGLDPVTFRTVQPIYVGRPIFAGGLADPIPVRSGVLEGLEDVVPVPDDLPEARGAAPAAIAFVPALAERAAAATASWTARSWTRRWPSSRARPGAVRGALGRWPAGPTSVP